MKAALPPDETQRLTSLREYDILDTDPEAGFDDLTLLAAQICQTPIAMVSLVDEHRQWFKSRIGVTATETSRDIAFCAHAILNHSEVMEVRDAEADPRFADNTLVTTDPHIRFYAGAPLVTPGGHALGALCVLDRTPRVLSTEQSASLRALSRHVVTQLELRLHGRKLQEEVTERQRVEARLREQNADLARSQEETGRLLALAEKSRSALLSVLEDEQQAGKSLRESEARFAKAFAANPAAMGINTVRDGRILAANDRYCELFGFTREEMVGKTIAELGLYQNPADRLLLMEALRSTGSVREREIRFRRKNGKMRDTLVSLELIDLATAKEPVLVSMFTDVTERKWAEAELRESEERFRQLAENINKVFWMTDKDITRMLYISPAYEKVWGRTCQSLYDRPTSFADSIHQDDRDQAVARMEQQKRGEETDAEYRILRPDGAVRWIHDRSFMVRNPAGEFYRIAGVAEDITDRKQLAEQFLRAQRMESIGSLAGGIAHDLNNALAPIVMASELLKLTSKDPANDRILDTIHESAKRGAGMVRQILTFARGSEGERGSVQPKHLVREMIDITRHTFPKSIQIRTDIANDTHSLLGNPTQLHQILLNLCVNARDAMPDGGTLTLATGNVCVTAGDTPPAPDMPPGQYVQLTVTDTGTGMTPEVRARIFEAFFTTKAPDKGTGLGLSTVHNIVQEHQGFLTVESEVGKGTTFRVYLRAQDASEPMDVKALPRALPMGKGELVLVVDDEAAIRSIATQTLQAYGYRVLTANDGAQAVGVCAQNMADLQLLITDIAMPIMGGKETIRAVHTILPRLPIIAVSGSDSVADALARELDVQAFLRKPFSADDLVRTVHEVLEGQTVT